MSILITQTNNNVEDWEKEIYIMCNENYQNAQTANQAQTPRSDIPAQGAYYGESPSPVCGPLTNREQAEKNVRYYREQADRHDRAAAFFRDNPAFDEFIQLIRAGAIQI
jgi:hypothetical protein